MAIHLTYLRKDFQSLILRKTLAITFLSCCQAWHDDKILRQLSCLAVTFCLLRLATYYVVYVYIL